MKAYPYSDVFSVVILATIAIALFGSDEHAVGAFYVAGVVAVHRLWAFVGRPWVDRRRSSTPVDQE